MRKVSVNKSELQKRRRELSRLLQILPSIDLKRKQLSLELVQEKIRQQQLLRELDVLEQAIGRDVPMLGAPTAALTGLVTVTAVELADDNLLGVRLPRLHEIRIARQPYAMLGHPHWVDLVLDRLENMLRLRATAAVLEERIRRIDLALRKTVQRVNLLEKVLLPRHRTEIRLIQIGLADAERSAVVRSKLIKSRMQS